MKICTIYNSYSGNTRGVAESVHAACGGELVEVKSKEYSTRLTAYTIGCYRAMKGMSDRIEPVKIDVSGSDLIVIGTPVWAGRATPAVNGAIAALTGCGGKPAVIFATCGGKGDDALRFMREALEAKGVRVAGEFVFDKNTVKDKDRINAMVSAVTSAAGTA